MMSCPRAPPEFLTEMEMKGYILKNVQRTRKKAGHGAYGYVEEVEVCGTICAAKKVHRVLLNNDNEGVEAFKKKFFSECIIMSRLRHPHIVQFLGVSFPSEDQIREEEIFESSLDSNNPRSSPQGLSLPWLIMEYLPINLDDFLKKNSSIPYSVKSSLLFDISKGIAYLHSQDPAIIHRDLTAKNILIDSSMVAKIADFGVARIVNPLSNTMSVGPGAMIYMPPDVQQNGEDMHSTHYDTSIDIFSFGVNILYTIVQECPTTLQPPVYLDPNDNSLLIAVSEVERRGKYFIKAQSLLTDESAPEHRLIGMSKSCLSNAASQRPSIETLYQELKKIKEELSDRLIVKDKYELMELAKVSGNEEEDEHRPSERDTVLVLQENRRLADHNESLKMENDEFQLTIRQLQDEKREFEEEKRQLELRNGELVEQKRRLEALQVVKHQESSRLLTEVSMLSNEVSIERKQRENLEMTRQNLENTIKQRNETIKHLEQQLETEMQIGQDRKSAMDILEENVIVLEDQVKVLSNNVHPPPPLLNVIPPTDQDKLKKMIETLQLQNAELEGRNTALKTEAQLLRKEMLEKAKGYQSTIDELRRPHPNTPSPTRHPSLPPSGIKVTLPIFWKQCLPTPSSVHFGQCVIFMGRYLLFGGGIGIGDNKRKILKFDLRVAKWSEFSLYLYEHFAMAVVMSKLYIIGGYNVVKDEYSSRVSEWSDIGSNWVAVSGDPLQTPRADAVAIGYRKWLIIAGGFNGVPLNTVECIDCETFSSSYVLPSLPEPAYAMQSAVYHDTSRSNGVAIWYLMRTGKGCGLDGRRPVFSVSLPHLIEKRTTWSVLPDPPLSNSAPVTVRGHLLAVGGRDQHACKKDIHMYFPGTNEWLKVADIQYPRHSCSCIPLSDKKFVVLGGQEKDVEYSCKVDQFDIKFNN